jgi:hypothetical protein
MAGNVSKWRLNKTESKQLDDETKAFYDAQIAAGMDKKDAQKERDNFYDKRSRELKSLKAAKSASKKAEQKRGAPEVEVAGKDDVAMGPDFNSDYYTAVLEAKKVILDNPIFCRIEAEAPLPIKEGDSGVQAGNYWLGLVQFEFGLVWFALLGKFYKSSWNVAHCSLTFTYLIFRRKKNETLPCPFRRYSPRRMPRQRSKSRDATGQASTCFGATFLPHPRLVCHYP